jgi:hypothetical protein
MLKRNCIVLLAIFSCLALNAAQLENSFAKNDELKPEQLVAEHLKSLGSPEARAAILTRAMGGSAAYKFIIGASGQTTGSAQWVSEKGKTGLILLYQSVEYPGEHFVFDGNKVKVDSIKTGQKSPLGDFLYRYSGIMKNSLLGGVLDVNWPLLNIAESKARMKCKKTSIDGRELMELEYAPQKNMGDVKVKMYFDPTNYRHVMTEYTVRLQSPADLKYTLTEKFDDFKQVDGITLPHKHTMEYVFEGGKGNFGAQYILDIMKITHNGKLDPQLFVAEE